MKITHTKLAFLIAMLLLAGGAHSLRAQGTTFTYQGRLTGQGSPASGSYEFRFSLFTAASGGSQVGTSLTNAPVSVSNGLFTVTLNFGAGIFTGTSRWLEIGVRTNSTTDFRVLSSRQLLTPSPYAMFSSRAGGVDWTNVNGVPAGFSNGYTAGAGLLLAGNQINVNFATNGVATNVARGDHNHVGQPWLTWTNLAGIPSSVTNGYTAGTGLLLAGNQFSVSFGGTGVATTASRTDHNHVGQPWFTWTNLSGIPSSVSNGYTAGTGLLLAGNQFSVSFGGTGVATTASRTDHNHVGQPWLTWTNIAGIPSSVSNGYTAGTGLLLAGNQFSVSFATNGVATNAARGDHNHVGQPWFTWTNLSGIPSSVSNGYTAGTGLLLAGNQFSVSFGGTGVATTASRTDHNHVGQPWLTWTNLAGIPSSVTNGYTAGAGLALVGNQFNVSFGGNGVATTSSRTDHDHVGQPWFTWTNLSGIPSSVSNGYTAGTGLLLAGNQFSVSFGGTGVATTASRTDHNHVGQPWLTWTNIAGIPSSVSNGYTAGTGLLLAGNQFSVSFATNGVATNAARGDHNHVGQPWFTWTNLSGIPSSVSNGYTAGTGLLLAGNQFSVSFGGTGVATTASRTDHNHVGQPWLTWTNLAGIPSSVSNGYTAGTGLLLAGNQFSVSFATNGVATNAARGDHNHVGQPWLTWTNLAGIPSSVSNVYSADVGLVLSNNQFSVRFGGNGVATNASRSDHDHHGQTWNGTNYDGLFVTTSATNGNALHGIANEGDQAYGVFGEAFNGYGVVGNGGTFGLYGFSSNGIAVWGESSGGPFAPQMWVVQDNTSDLSRLRIGVVAGRQWDIAVGPGTNASFNLFSGNSNVVTVDVSGNVTAKSFNPSSDRNVKEEFDSIDARQILTRLATLPIQTWKFKDDAATRHIGPMAQDFYAAFNVGPDDKHIATVDADGVALAAIQGLNEVVREKEARIEALEKSVAELKATVNALAGKQTADHR